MTALHTIRQNLRRNHLRDEHAVLGDLTTHHAPGAAARAVIKNRATALVSSIRNDSDPGLMEVFLAEYGLSTNEGVALMCLAEALLRVPDAETIDALIEDKIAPSAWGQHLGQSSSSLVNASTWALMLTGKVLQDGTGITATLKGALKRLGEPVIRAAVSRAMKEMGAQFVLGQTIEEAVKRGAEQERAGYTYSYDMLGEAALTAQDAQNFFDAYRDAITKLAKECRSQDIRENPGISIKLSALHPRYEVGQTQRIMQELVPLTLQLAQQAKAANMGLNIDAEEADRLDLSLDVIEAVLRDPSLAGWDGFGVVVQAYGKRAGDVLDWLHSLAAELDRKIMVRLVKGAYWDTEVKRAQVEGLAGFPVYTRKAATDVSYICCAGKLLQMTDRIYPQFATHNAHTVAAILELATDTNAFEFQRLHGMGDSLHDIVLKQNATRCRIYAPVGAHRDLLAYLVRRLLENGANSSFVNQIVDESVAPDIVAADPFETLENTPTNAAVKLPCDLYGKERVNSTGWDLHDLDDLDTIEQARGPFRSHQWAVAPLIEGTAQNTVARTVLNPARHDDVVGTVAEASVEDVETALSAARPWDADANARADTLNRAADLYERNFGQLFAVLTREAGKTPMDAIAELREAVDFLRYYAARGQELSAPARGVFACISPWNFPLAIFTGQIAAALAAGNGVIAKPAEPTAITATLATTLLHEAGVPHAALQLLPGRGSVVGAALTSDPRVNGVCFTGSTQTAQTINRAMTTDIAPEAPLIAETGGLNAMIVDSTALPEQAVKDIVASAFQSAGQRCSALRILYVQEDVAEPFLQMLYGAMDELVIGDPWDLRTDVGPVITPDAQHEISAYIAAARNEGRVLKELATPDAGTFIAPSVLRVSGIAALEKEVFGPVMHVATFKAAELDTVVDAINASGFGLTFGMHSRIDDRIEQVTSRLNVGNMYINRNQIGAIVGSQPFGGEGLSGTGPKAGGPAYVKRFARAATRQVLATPAATSQIDQTTVEAALAAAPHPARTTLLQQELPGPTGESNILSTYGRGLFLCLGPTLEAARAQAEIARAHGCTALVIADGADGVGEVNGTLPPAMLEQLQGFEGVVSWAEEATLRQLRTALAKRTGALIPLMTEEDFGDRCHMERHICIDTTAAGGNASLLADAS
ncbi:bifunctional proline dehydrogenase/L-glutamate gamma-semialdehyde dehydrogenase PutA [Thalassovita mediterranea]|jgi:RHH-type proline utilization regulon transcriptional repressor/proline dehydrogenase/delta 1-pyrroline-5-carboxylate dehydrogenase|uniref:Bifunctional protein PutA n=1 Tax=Thalassovita mediterranea TaxID=340021 RepID=A0A0P1GRL6_9RHOB|nr:bifunctional proline dehydrogenase/L-glutamate gamma-semialdehyde dehydrogenase PutA [Thalassovita mediterranea]CUH85244.1 Bifunctional protein PutA [Thalassovita mediterranea]SIS30645.1 L-proline dehydrogenase /delta-1-pyrroline-5-carboxylate dehydrogenase [Thalassovita mediterranea]